MTELEAIFGRPEGGNVTVQQLLDELSKVRDKQKSVLICKWDRDAETHEAWKAFRVVDRSGYFDVEMGEPTTDFDTSPEHREFKANWKAKREAKGQAQ